MRPSRMRQTGLEHAATIDFNASGARDRCDLQSTTDAARLHDLQRENIGDAVLSTIKGTFGIEHAFIRHNRRINGVGDVG